MIALYKKYTTTNNYVGSDWNFEKTTKYVFTTGHEYIEAGYFIHYLKSKNNLEEKKHVIELPSSYGCLMQCKFCASSQVTNIRHLNASEIYEIFLYIFYQNHLNDKNNILVSMMGIGDLYFTLNIVETLLQKIHANYSNIYFSISSCYWTEKMLKRIEFLNTFINFRTIQITYITYNADKLKLVIQYYKKVPYNVNTLIQIIKQSNIKEFKINYILIKGINDSAEDIATFISKFNEIKDKIIIRISQINATQASQKNGIKGASIEQMRSFKKQLLEHGYKSYLFYSCKDDKMNCGQLITEHLLT